MITVKVENILNGGLMMTNLNARTKEELLRLKQNLESKIQWSERKIAKIERELKSRESEKVSFIRYEGR